MSWTCRYCGKDTSDIDYDYLDGYDHLSCALENFNNKKVMKIKGWEKISGYTYKGYTIVNPIHNAQETSYNATILNLNLPQKPKWELSVLTPQHKFIVGENTADGIFYIVMWDDNKNHISRHVSKQRMKSISIFRNEFEEMIDEMLSRQITSAPISHSLNTAYSKSINTNLYVTATGVNTGGGIMSTINSNGNTTTWNPNTNLPSSMLMSIKDLQEQIDNLKNKYVNNK